MGCLEPELQGLSAPSMESHNKTVLKLLNSCSTLQTSISLGKFVMGLSVVVVVVVVVVAIIKLYLVQTGRI